MPSTVLIADDSKIVRTFVKIQLVRRKFTYVEADDGDEAIEILRSRPVDLVIAGVNMPRKGGLSLLADVRSSDDPARRGIPFILITADHDRAAKGAAEALGVSAFLHKPVTGAGTLQAVDGALPVSVV